MPRYGTVVPCPSSCLAAIVPIELVEVPPLKVNESAGLGASYASDASVLCGDWICGGPLDISAASIAGSRPGYAVPFTGPVVDRF